MASKIAERIARGFYGDLRGSSQAWVDDLAIFLDKKGLNEMWQLCQHQLIIVPESLQERSVGYKLASEALRKAGE